MKAKVHLGTAQVVPGAVAAERKAPRVPRAKKKMKSPKRSKDAIARVVARTPVAITRDPGMTVAVRVFNANLLPKDVRRALYLTERQMRALGLATAAYLAALQANCEPKHGLPTLAPAIEVKPAGCARASVSLDGVMQTLAYDDEHLVCTVLERLDGAASAASAALGVRGVEPGILATVAKPVAHDDHP